MLFRSKKYKLEINKNNQSWLMRCSDFVYHNHRIDGPAVIRPNGSRAWYQNGKLHRLNGPAVIRPNGYQEWFQNGKLHRLDGPAVIDPDGCEYWYQKGILGNK